MFSRLQRTFLVLAVMAAGSVAFAQTPVLVPVDALAPSSMAAPATSPVPTPNLPIDAHSRLQWLLVENLDAASLADDVAVGAVDTFFKTPKEYQQHWDGFGMRIGLVTANYALKSSMEAGLGSLWGEDPRYVPTNGLTVKGRMAYVIKMTFLAGTRDGKTMPAYSRYIAFPASSFISNEWTPHSQSNAADAGIRVGLGFLSRMGENAWKEFIAPRK